MLVNITIVLLTETEIDLILKQKSTCKYIQKRFGRLDWDRVKREWTRRQRPVACQAGARPAEAAVHGAAHVLSAVGLWFSKCEQLLESKNFWMPPCDAND